MRTMLLGTELEVRDHELQSASFLISSLSFTHWVTLCKLLQAAKLQCLSMSAVSPPLPRALQELCFNLKQGRKFTDSNKIPDLRVCNDTDTVPAFQGFTGQ